MDRAGDKDPAPRPSGLPAPARWRGADGRRDSRTAVRDRLAHRRRGADQPGTDHEHDDNPPRLRPTGIGLKTVTWTDTDPNAGLVVNPAPGAAPVPGRSSRDLLPRDRRFDEDAGH